MEVQVGNSGFLTVVSKNDRDGEKRFPLKAPTFKQIKNYSNELKIDSFDALEKLLLSLGLPQEVMDQLSVMDVNTISDKMAELLTKKK